MSGTGSLDPASVARHWYSGPPGSLLARIDSGLRASGVDPAAPGPDDLAAVDEFHIRGREATAELVALAGFEPGQRILDVGAGLGGPARALARHGCSVTGVDLTEEYCLVANALAQRLGLAERATFRQADALALPFEDASFDGAWTVHISMNIRDKRRFFAEMARVVKPGGRLALYDPIAGDGRALEFPVPWAQTPELSCLIDSDATRALLEELGLEILVWKDVSEISVAWFEARLKPGTPPPLGLHLLAGSVWPTMVANMRANLTDGRLRVVQIVARRPDA